MLLRERPVASAHSIADMPVVARLPERTLDELDGVAADALGQATRRARGLAAEGAVDVVLTDLHRCPQLGELGAVLGELDEPLTQRRRSRTA